MSHQITIGTAVLVPRFTLIDLASIIGSQVGLDFAQYTGCNGGCNAE